MAEKMKNSERFSIVPKGIRDMFRESQKTKEDQESPKPNEKQEKMNASMGEGYKKGGMVRAKKAPAKMAKGGMMCSPRKKMAMGKGYKKGGMVRRSGCK